MAEIDREYESHHDPTDSYSWSIPAIRRACCAGPSRRTRCHAAIPALLPRLPTYRICNVPAG